jgi:hypothetical protein
MENDDDKSLGYLHQHRRVEKKMDLLTHHFNADEAAQ